MQNNFVGDEGQEDTLRSLHVQSCKAASENKSITLKPSEKEVDQVTDFADATVFAGASECAAKLPPSLLPDCW